MIDKTKPKMYNIEKDALAFNLRLYMETTMTERNTRSSSRQSTKSVARQKERVQFDFSEDMLKKLDYIMERTGAATRAEAVRNALRVYDWFIDTDPNDNIKVIGKNDEVRQAFKAKLLLS
jgi:hypothetical protein